jgi:argininosuccinate lyase
MTEKTTKQWGGRFTQKTHLQVEAFTSSIQFDKKLYEYDIQGSIAHCKMLAKQSIISQEEASVLIEGLGRIKRQIEHGNFDFDDSLEDVHTHVEHGLLQDVGKVARKLHTARSRNDQVAVDMRLYLKEETSAIIEHLIQLRRVIVDLAKQYMDIIMPGYTHMQRAQPVLLAHHLLAYYEMFKRDGERFTEALQRIDIMPLGSAALAGTTHIIDREYTAQLLGFRKSSANSIDAVSDRDFIIEFLSAASICMMHLSRWSEELILWSTEEFKFIVLPDGFTTGSSIMPQKKNPDVCELVRGKTGRVYGNLFAALTLMKALPLSYNRDMQEDKEPLFDTVDTLKACIGIYTQMLPEIRINRDVMLQAASKGFLNATDMADYLVSKGLPFRDAHNCVGKAVAYALKQKKELHELKVETLRSFSDLVDEDIYAVLTTRSMVNRRTSGGGTATENVRAAADRAADELKAATRF